MKKSTIVCDFCNKEYFNSDCLRQFDEIDKHGDTIKTYDICNLCLNDFNKIKEEKTNDTHRK